MTKMPTPDLVADARAMDLLRDLPGLARAAEARAARRLARRARRVPGAHASVRRLLDRHRVARPERAGR